MNGGINKPTWGGTGLYAGYLKDVQRFYEREPVIQVSVQLILSVFTVAFFMFFAVRPTLGTISTLLKKIDDQETASAKLDAKISQLIQAQEVLATNGPQFEALSKKAVPVTPEIERLAKQIEAVANESNVYITSMEFQTIPLIGDQTVGDSNQTKSKTAERKFVVFGFTVGGTQEEIISFLGQLDRMERAVQLTKVEFAKPGANYTRIFPLTLTGKATVYYLPEKEEG